jgi:hypothetical protein
MIALPKLVLLILAALAMWYAKRWWNQSPTKLMRRQQPPSPQPAIQDLVVCRVCSAYVAADAGGCGRPDCPPLR